MGQKFGREGLALRMADIFVIPARTGLAILDSFAAGLPLFTTDIAIHGPEAETYLIDGYNGRKTVRPRPGICRCRGRGVEVSVSA